MPNPNNPTLPADPWWKHIPELPIEPGDRLIYHYSLSHPPQRLVAIERTTLSQGDGTAKPAWRCYVVNEDRGVEKVILIDNLRWDLEVRPMVGRAICLLADEPGYDVDAYIGCWRGDAVTVAMRLELTADLVRLVYSSACCFCGEPLEGEFVGAGDGTGQRFAHPECYARDKVEKTLALLRRPVFRSAIAIANLENVLRFMGRGRS